MAEPTAKFTLSSAQTIAATVREVRQNPRNDAPTRRASGTTDNRLFWGRLSSDIAFDEVYTTIVSGVLTWNTLTDGRSDNLSFGGGASGDVVMIRQDFDVSATPPTPLYEMVGLVGTFVVSLTENGVGSDGNDTSPPSYEYTVNWTGGTPGTNDLATNSTPQEGRVNGSFFSASRGLGYFTGGTFQLLYAFESPKTTGCPGGGG